MLVGRVLVGGWWLVVVGGSRFVARGSWFVVWFVAGGWTVLGWWVDLVGGASWWLVVGDHV